MEKEIPRIGKKVYIDPSAQVIGRVRIGGQSSVWPNSVVRGDISPITIGRSTNIQDLSVIHVETGRPCRIGNFVTVGHRAVIHACTVKDNVLVGMGSIVMDSAVIGKGTILGAGSLVTSGQKLKPGSLYFGRPAKFVRVLSRREIAEVKKMALRYVRYAEDYGRQRYGRFGQSPD